jgi:hypothetical protein
MLVANMMMMATTYTGRRPTILARGLVRNRPSPIVRTSQAVDWERVSTLIPRFCETTTNPGDSMGP